MIASEIIAKFETQVDDGTELSVSQELDLLNKKYTELFIDRPWEFSKKAFSGNINGTSIALPTDFAYVSENASFTDVSYNNLNGNQSPKIVWVGTTYYILVNYSDRRQYNGRSGYCWVNMGNSTLEFSTAVSGAIDYDYVFFPEALAIDDSPIFPASFHYVLVHMMATEDYIIQQFDKAKSYAAENKAMADNWKSQMALWNANLICN